MKNKEQQFYEFLKKNRAYKRWMRLKVEWFKMDCPSSFVSGAFVWPKKESEFWIKIYSKWNDILKKDEDDE